MEYDMHEKTRAIFDMSMNYDPEISEQERNEFIQSGESFNDVSNGLMEYLVRNGLDPDADPAAALKYLEEMYRQKGVDFDRTTLRNWLNKHFQGGIREGSRPVIHSLCFALGLDEKKSAEFITKVFFERPFNFRDAEEVIYFFCLKNGYDYQCAKECKKYFDSLGKSEAVDTGETKIIRSEIGSDKEVSLDHLKNYLYENRELFHDNMRSAKRNAKKWLVKAYTYTKHFKNKNIDPNSISLDDVDINALLIEILNFDMKNINRNHSASIKKDFGFVNYVALNFPDNTRLGNLKNDKDISYDALRKIIILMNFFAYCSECILQKEKKYVDLDEYEEQINTILHESGFGDLYFRNPYDWLFLHSICVVIPERDALDEFQDMISDMYRPDDENDF